MVRYAPGRKGGAKVKITEKDGNVILEDVRCLDIGLCLDCGQAFRFSKNEDGSFHGVVGGTVLDVKQEGDICTFYHTTKDEFMRVWYPYFDLERDYEKICESFDDEYLIRACREYYGIRILRQDRWEALCSFIISQNNNIPRIKGIVERLCEAFGEKTGENDYSFPSYEVLADKTVEDLAPLRSGFRAKYIIDAAQKVRSGEVNLEKLDKIPIEEARQELMKIKGVGAKVAECTLLYGVNLVDAFPVDVWVRRICQELYPDGLPVCIDGVRGIAQQYLFHWRRNLSESEALV